MRVQLGGFGRQDKPFPLMTGSFTACSIPSGYAMNMKMIWKPVLMALVAAPLAFAPMQVPDASARGPKDEQDQARRAMLEGRVMPFSVIRRRMEREMGEATYIGVRPPAKGVYRMQYLTPDGRVIWVDVDGKTGEIVGRTR